MKHTLQSLRRRQDGSGVPAVLQRGLAHAAERLTGSHRRLAEFMARAYQDVAFLSAAELGRRTGVSPATVVRFARILGFNGYPELQEKLQAAMKAEVGGLQRLHRTAAHGSGERSVLGEVVETDIRNLQETLRGMPEGTFREAVHLLVTAPAVHILGLRSSHALALYLAYFLGMIRGNVRCVQPGFGNLPEQLVDVRPGDAVVGITFRSYTRETLEILGTIGQVRPRLLVITDSLVFPLAGKTDVILGVATEHPSFLESSVPALALINALISAVAAAGRPATLERLRRHQGLWDSLRTYWVDRTNRDEEPMTPAGMLRRGARARTSGRNRFRS